MPGREHLSEMKIDSATAKEDVTIQNSVTRTYADILDFALSDYIMFTWCIMKAHQYAITLTNVQKALFVILCSIHSSVLSSHFIYYALLSILFHICE